MKKQSINCTSTLVRIKVIFKLTRLGPTVLYCRPCFADYGTGNSYQLYLELV